jgi:hypothetical protein
VNTRRSQKQILRAHLPDQRTQFDLDRRSPSPSTRLQTPIAAKAGPMPTCQRFGSNNHESWKDRREPAIELNEEPAIVVRKTSPALQLTAQDDQLTSERGILSLNTPVFRQTSIANPLWGAPRIDGELLKLGIDVGQTSVAKYMVRRRVPPSQGWRIFLRNHGDGIAAMDLFVVPTVSFRLL